MLGIFYDSANNEKSFDQISKGIALIFSSGAFPIILGGDHSIGYGRTGRLGYSNSTHCL